MSFLLEAFLDNLILPGGQGPQFDGHCGAPPDPLGCFHWSKGFSWASWASAPTASICTFIEGLPVGSWSHVPLARRVWVCVSQGAPLPMADGQGDRKVWLAGVRLGHSCSSAGSGVFAESCPFAWPPPLRSPPSAFHHLPRFSEGCFLKTSLSRQDIGIVLMLWTPPL